MVVLKGAHTIVAEPQGTLYINPTGNPGMATGGTGDVLAGMIGALLGQRYQPAEAACIGAFVHGLAGDLAAVRLGQRSLTAWDVVEALPQAFEQLERVKVSPPPRGGHHWIKGCPRMPPLPTGV